MVADLVRTQATLQARSEQLQEIFASRWYRLARLFWRLRRGAIFRKSAPPRLAGEDSFVRSLNGDAPPAEEPEVKLVPSLSGTGVAVDLERQRWLAGARAPGLEQLRIAAILDPASEASLAPECDLDTGFGTTDWRERLESHPPHLLLVESALAGNGGSWRGAVAAHPSSAQAGLPALSELAGWSRDRGIPTAFWATRDPLGFDRFAEAASLFDHVFTVDSDRIGAYRALPESAAQTVAALPLAVQPRLHNPIGSAGRRKGVAFAGVFDRGWPRARREELANLLEAARKPGLVIYEHDAEAGEGDHSFPPRFLPFVGGRVPNEETAAIYKRHCVFLNAGPTATSPTAIPRQLFELLACGTPVLSAPSAAVEEILGELVAVAAGGEEAAAQLERLLGDEAYRASLAVRGQRHVLAAHTYRDRLDELVAAAGFDIAAGAEEETAVLLLAGRGEELGEAADSLLEQSLAPNELLIGTTSGAGERDLDRLAKRFPGARIRTLSQSGEMRSSARLRELARLAAAPWVAPIVPMLRYSPHHLRDLVACTRFADAQVIGFARAANGEPHRYADAVPSHAALAKRELVASRGWPRDEAAMRQWFAGGVRIYAGEAIL